jgi:RNA polymerase sigma factor (sigma-70 family)
MHLHPGSTEADLISQCKKGSLKHQEMLYKHFYGFAMGVALRYCINRDDAMEVVNDGFIKVFNTVNSYQADKPFKAWLRTIVVNTAIDRRRKELKHQMNTDIDNAPPVSANTFIIETIQAQDILKLMDSLPGIQRTVFNLYEIDGYSHEEISQMMAIPASTSRVYLTRAKDKLRKLLIVEAP